MSRGAVRATRATTPPDRSPGAAQLDSFDRRPGVGPVILVYRYRVSSGAKRVLESLVELSRPEGGALLWAGSEEQVLVGPLELFDSTACLRFDTRTAARAFVLGRAHADLFAAVEMLEVHAVSDMPRVVGVVSALAAWIAPRLPLDATLDDAPEPGIGTGIMPAAQPLAAFRAHPCQDSPVVMINWLQYRDEARYDPPRAPCSGAAAYQRYGRTALLAVHGLGGKVLFLGRWQQQLIGASGAPQAGRWDEFVLVQYPGRATFAQMTALRRYRRALVHRSAGLAELGQGLVISQPEPRFVWRK